MGAPCSARRDVSDARRSAGRIAGRSLVAAALCGCAAAVAAAPRGSADRHPPAETRRGAEEARLEAVRGEIRELQERLAGTESRAGSIVDAMDEIDLRIALLGRESVALRQEERAAAAREDETRRQAQDLTLRLSQSEEALGAWLREVYKVGPVQYLRLVAASSSPTQVAAAHRAAEAMGLAEGRQLEQYRAERERLDEALLDLQAQRQEHERLRAELRHKEAELRDSRRSKEAVLAGLKRQRASQETALRELTQVQKEIQTLLSRLQGPGGEEMVPSLGFARHRGQLRWPAQGTLAIPFGNVRNPRFSTVVPHPGIDIAIPPGQDVRSVFAGRVVFSNWFKGYGQMVVIDHGDGYLSIYGHVQERLVAAGEEVRQGDLIARSGEGGSFDTPGLYFEIRHDGKPEDPAGWLQGPLSRATDRRSRPLRGAHAARTSP